MGNINYTNINKTITSHLKPLEQKKTKDHDMALESKVLTWEQGWICWLKTSQLLTPIYQEIYPSK